MEQPTRKLIYRSTIKREYGLTDAMIEELGPPDKSVVNPHYHTAAKSQLYLRERVERWVEANRERVDAAMARREARSRRNQGTRPRRVATPQRVPSDILAIAREAQAKYQAWRAAHTEDKDDNAL